MNRIKTFLAKLQLRKPKTQKEIDQQAIIGTTTNSDLPKYRILPNLRFAYALPLIIIFAGFGIYSIFGGKAASVCTTTLSPGADVISAVGNAPSGSTICLHGGNYSNSAGYFRFSAGSTNKSNYVTITSVEGEMANFTSYLLFDNARYISIQNVKVNGGLTFSPAGANIEVKNNEITGGTGVTLFGDNRSPAESGPASCPCSIHDVNIEGNNIHDLQYNNATQGLGSGVGVGGFGDAYNVTVKNNTIKSAASDYMQSGMIHDWTVDGNTFLGPSLQYPDHPTDHQDLWQIFGCDVGCYDTNHLIYNITYTNNVARNTGTAESLLFQNAYFRNVNVTNNLFDHDSRGTTVQIYNTDGLTYRYNTHLEEAQYADGNQAALFRDGGGTAGQNYRVDHNIFIKISGAAGAIGSELRASSWGTYDYNVTNDGSAAGSNSIKNWTPNWVNTTDYEPVGLPYLAGYRKSGSSTPSCSTKPGDTNNDQVVNITDIAEILKLYGQTNSTSCADTNKDTVINITDIAVVLQNYGSTGQTSPSGEAMPTEKTITSGGNNWEQIFADDFITDVPLGAFPSAVAGKWSAYPDGTRDTFCNGVFYPSKVNSVANGILNHNLHDETVTYTIWPGQEKPACPTAGTFTKQIRLGSALVPKIGNNTNDQLYGRYAIRFKTDALPNYYAAWLLWPESEVWPRDGEIDWPEGALSGTMNGFVHWMNGTSGSDQQGCSSTTKFLDTNAVNKWNTVVTEWAPGSVKFYANNQLICTVTGSRVPSTPMHYVLQTETGDTAINNWVDGNLQVDWVAIYKKL